MPEMTEIYIPKWDEDVTVVYELAHPGVVTTNRFSDEPPEVELTVAPEWNIIDVYMGEDMHKLQNKYLLRDARPAICRALTMAWFDDEENWNG